MHSCLSWYRRESARRILENEDTEALFEILMLLDQLCIEERLCSQPAGNTLCAQGLLMISPQKAQQGNNPADLPTHDMGRYAAPKRDINPQHTATYHRTDLAGLEGKKWEWDLRGQEGSYLGNYGFNG